ncbi:MAG: hypothetical protein WKF30_05795 [Pyrinomonadaceae bacterium]
MSADESDQLKCDAVAMQSVKLLGGNPTYCIRGVKRMVNLMHNDSLSSVSYIAQSKCELRTHPSVVERAVFSQRFIKLLT